MDTRLKIKCTKTICNFKKVQTEDIISCSSVLQLSQLQKIILKMKSKLKKESASNPWSLIRNVASILQKKKLVILHIFLF